MFGINGGELIVLLIVIAIVVGPERLPGYAQQLGKWARSLKELAQSAKARVDDELGGESLDWEALDPRQYDPRRIVREALRDDLRPAPTTRNTPHRYTAPVATATGPTATVTKHAAATTLSESSSDATA